MNTKPSVANAERDAAQAKADLAELKRSLPVSPDLKAAAMAADVIKPQRKSAKQLLARADVTLEKLQGIDASLLTPMDQERPSIAWSGRQGGMEATPRSGGISCNAVVDI